MGSAYEPALKKARIFEVPAAQEVNGSGAAAAAAAVNGFGSNIALVNDGSVSGADQQAAALAALNGDLECRRFSTMEGCPYGTKCRFKHGASGNILTLHHMLMYQLWHMTHMYACILFYSHASSFLYI